MTDNKKSILAPSYEETIQIEILENVILQIRKDLLKDRHNYLWRDDNPKDGYERGILNAIRLIQHRIHCIIG